MSIELATAGGSKLSLDASVFGAEFNEALIHQVVTAHLAGARAGTKRQKNRSEVAGGAAKPWRQKKTGRARAGTTRGPIWRTGGRAFAARPQNWSQKVNRKAYGVAMRSILSELVRQERLVVVSQYDVSEPKTKAFGAYAKSVGFDRGLVVIDENDDNVALAARNIPHVYVSDVQGIDPVSLVSCDQVLITEQALKSVEERFK